MESDDGTTKASVCKAISCLLPTDLEVKRACQLTEFLLDPTVDAYYIVETLYNEPDQKVEEEKMPVPNSLRCELLLVLKTHWPFDPEFWDWRTLKRQCLSLMGEEASIVSSIDLLNNNEEHQQEEGSFSQGCFNHTSENFMSGTFELPDVQKRRRKTRKVKLREKSFIYTKYRNWQAYMQYCVLCDKEFLGHRIVRHAQIHFCNGVYRCPICAQSFSSKDIFLPHVKSHVKQSCKERLSALQTTRELPSPEVVIPDTAALKVKAEDDYNKKFVSQMKNGILLRHLEIRLSRCDMETADAYVCPVGKCRRSFKFLKNLVAHVKDHGDDKEAETFLEMRRKRVMCKYCRRRFVSAAHLNDHLQVHCGSNPYVCVQLNCKARFRSNSELLQHKRTHPVFRAKCMYPNCLKIFSQAFKLYDHEELHYKRFTCKAVDCGRVFPSLKLLDLHQEKHASIKKGNASSGAKPQNMQPASLIKQLLTSHGQPESSQEKPSSESVARNAKVISEPQTTSFQTSQSQNLINSAIQCVNPNLSDSNRHKGGKGGHSFDSTRSLSSNNSDAQMANPQLQMFKTNAAVASVGYKSDCNLPLPKQQEPMARPSSVLPLSTPVEPVSQPLAAVKSGKSLTLKSGTAPPAGQKKQYHCPLETCRRFYSAHRSVTKHMRVIHPDFYEQWKSAQTPIKVTYGLSPKVPLVRYDCSGDQQKSRLPVLGVPGQNVIQSPPYTSTTSPNRALGRSQCSSHNQTASVQMSNVLIPAVLSQQGGDERTSNGQKWHSAFANEQIQHSGSLKVCPSDMQGMPRVDCMTTALLPNSPSFSTIAATTPAETLLAPPVGSGSHSVLPTCMTGTKEPSQQPSQMQISGTSSSADGIQSMQEHAEVDVPSSASESQRNINVQPQNFPRLPKNEPSYHEQAKSRRKSKWPAIVRDGKFICPLCFKEFISHVSLGGHLSKGALCQRGESGLNTDRPESLLDCIRSEQAVVPSQPSLCFSQNAVLPQSVINASTSTNLNFPPDNLPVDGNVESDDIKEICAETSAPDHYNPRSNPTQHQAPSFSVARCSQASVKTYDGSQFSNSVHPRVLSGNLPIGPGSTKQREQYNSEGQNSVVTKDTNLNSDPQATLSDSQTNSSGSGRPKETHRNLQEGDVKRLQEQMVAGEFQPGTKLVRNADANTKLNNSLSFGSLCNPPSNSVQLLSDTNSNSANHKDSASIPETAVNSLNTLSFTGFRENLEIRSEVPSPEGVITHDADLEPSVSAASQHQCMTEIQSAFEKLNSVTEGFAQMSVPVKPNPKAVVRNKKRKAGPANGKVLYLEQFKPFACESENCAVRFMTSDALWKHLSKRHNYTADMVNATRKRYGQYAPFKCEKCSKSFTRNSTLRLHYHTTHKLSANEIEDMGLRRMQAASQVTTSTDSSLGSKTQMYSSRDAVTRRCSSQPFVSRSNVVTVNDKHQDLSHLTPLAHLQAAGPWSQANGLPPLDNQSAIKSETKKPSKDTSKKTKDKRPSSDHGTRPFKPFRCIRQGCDAAFTSQHSLILHYKVVHQSALSALAVSTFQAHNNGLDRIKSQGEDSPEEQFLEIPEFRCQVKDCSHVFKEVLNLVLHYLQLHRFGMDNIGGFLSNIKPQTFICGYQGCPAFFSTACRYIGHVREQHNDMLAQPEQLHCSFRCEFKGCGRSYATKSNVVRHYMKIHGKLYRANLKKEQIKRTKMKRSSGALRYQITKTMNGKENIESNRKIWKRGDAKRRKRSKTNIWTTYGKPSLKTNVEASALCTKKFPLQYPCMIKGCESVLNSERNILKHYLGHGLSEKFLEHQRSHFIFCKKAPRLRWGSLRSDDSKSDSELSSSELTAETSPDEDDSGGSKPVLRRRTSAKMPIVLFDSKLSNIEGFAGSVVVKRKRGRPRKFPERVKRKKIPRSKLDLDSRREEVSDFSSPALMQEKVTKLSTPLATFKPMGFEMSFLKFLEQSNQGDHSLTTKGGVPERFPKSSIPNTKDICVLFRNHKKLKSLSKVKIIIDGAFSGVTNLMLAQLQDMQPTVVLRGK